MLLCLVVEPIFFESIIQVPHKIPVQPGDSPVAGAGCKVGKAEEIPYSTQLQPSPSSVRREPFSI